jgi:hypothetical protein
MLTRECGAVKIHLHLLQRHAVAFRSRPSLTPLLGAHRSGKVSPGGGMAANYRRVVCAQCDQPEESCTCEKYCVICKGQHNIRLGADGLYYCPDCREACDVALANDR